VKGERWVTRVSEEGLQTYLKVVLDEGEWDVNLLTFQPTTNRILFVDEAFDVLDARANDNRFVWKGKAKLSLSKIREKISLDT
jgi:hypothetical protein